MSRTLVFDGLRLALGASVPAPRGIDRVDLLYARFLFANWPGECLGLLPTPWGMRVFHRNRGIRLIDAIEAHWRETTDAESDGVFLRVRRRLIGGSAAAPEGNRATAISPARALCREIALLADTGFEFGASAIRRASHGAVYLNVGQLGWASRWTTRWLRHRPDIRPVFMLHDVIPMLHGDLVSPSCRSGHTWMLDAVRRYAAGLITTTDVARDAVIDTLEYDHRSINIYSAHLPIAPVFLEPDGHDHILGSQEYFLVCGAIEPRKNHLMLLNVWQRLVQDRGSAAPRLVIAGSPAYRGRDLLRQFERCRALSHSVVAVSGLSSPGLRRLIAHARAMLTPSLAEGFGLPLAEALAVGTPVLASDLLAHREVGGHHAVYLDPSDEAGWFASISRMMDDPTYVAELRRCVAEFQPVTGERYFADVQAFLEGIG